jgi:site-specific recombinase XerD
MPPVARIFLAWLHENDLIEYELAACVPSPRPARPMPSVYTADEMRRLLAAVDRTTAFGRRDYAILMLDPTLDFEALTSSH